MAGEQRVSPGAEAEHARTTGGCEQVKLLGVDEAARRERARASLTLVASVGNMSA